MSFSKLVAHFRDKEDFPIQIDEIVSWLTSNGFQDEISFYPVEMDSKTLRGVMTQYTRRDGVYGEPKLITDILYPKSANACWERMICCKELMHLFDTPLEKTKTSEQIDKLTSSLTSPAGKDSSPDYFAEGIAIYRALLLLAPIEIIERLRPHYDTGAKQDYDIALFLRIPEHYIGFLFSSAYMRIAHGLLGLQKIVDIETKTGS